MAEKKKKPSKPRYRRKREMRLLDFEFLTEKPWDEICPWDKDPESRESIVDTWAGIRIQMGFKAKDPDLDGMESWSEAEEYLEELEGEF